MGWWLAVAGWLICQKWERGSSKVGAMIVSFTNSKPATYNTIQYTIQSNTIQYTCDDPPKPTATPIPRATGGHLAENTSFPLSSLLEPNRL